jgi:RNA polymerase sigma-70 factor (ECF subfamily)
VWQNLESFKAESQLYTWLYRISANEALTFLNKKKKRFFLPLVDVEAELSEKVEADPGISGDEVQLKLQKAILSLPDKQRLVFQMRYYDEMPYEEMSKVLGTSVGALKASYHHAAKKIEAYITGES